MRLQSRARQEAQASRRLTITPEHARVAFATLPARVSVDGPRLSRRGSTCQQHQHCLRGTHFVAKLDQLSLNFTLLESSMCILKNQELRVELNRRRRDSTGMWRTGVVAVVLLLAVVADGQCPSQDQFDTCVSTASLRYTTATGELNKVC